MSISGLDSLCTLADKVTRSISPENFTGEKGMGGRTPLEEGSAKEAARDLSTGWKVNPYFVWGKGEHVLADIEGSGTIKHFWITTSAKKLRTMILRMYWDNSDVPSVECPLGDFFCNGWEQMALVNSLAVCANPGKAFNCYWSMPFKKHARITLENRIDEPAHVYYQITYEQGEVPENAAYFHARFNRINPLPYKGVYTIADGIEGCGQYVGTYMAWGVNNCGWWGEGEIKFYMDGDKEYPTICGTGTEDYFCGAYNFDMNGQYIEFTSPYTGLCQVLRPDGTYRSQTRFGMYRWHITDPIYFKTDLKVTIQALGWRSGGRYLPLQDDMASVCFYYLDRIDKQPKTFTDDELEVN